MESSTLIVDGLITDQPGPYTVQLFKSSSIEDDLLRRLPYGAKHVIIHDDLGNSEELESSLGDGIYTTDSTGIRGVIGRKYTLQIEAFSGAIFESEPAELKSSTGGIDSLYWVWDNQLPRQGPTNYGFRIFVTTNGRSDKDTFLRWKFTGTYKVLTYPRYKTQYEKCTSGPNAVIIPCSGYSPENPYGICTCCYCWVNDVEARPYLNDERVFSGDGLDKIEIGYVPFDEWRFEYFNYLVTVEQFDLTYEAYEFWKVIRDQKEGAESIFQPNFGKIGTNMHSKNSDELVTGIFYASSVHSKFIIIKSKDAPLPVPEHSLNPEENCYFWDACDQVWPNAFRTPPPGWSD